MNTPSTPRTRKRPVPKVPIDAPVQEVTNTPKACTRRSPSPKPSTDTKPAPKKPRKPRKAPAKPALSAQPVKGKLRKTLLLIGLEALSLIFSGVIAIIVLLGYTANRFSGSNWADNLLPFALGILALMLSGALTLIAWWKLRRWLRSYSNWLMPILSLCLALGIGWLALHERFTFAFGQFKTLVGGQHEAERVTLTHQVFAAYRRQNQGNLQTMMTRAEPYSDLIDEAAQAFEVDSQLLQGIAATESSFLPRTSQDGGRGLFQITLVPKSVLADAARLLAVEKVVLDNHRHNAFVAAATLKYYLAQMDNDPFLGLLAYNIGPANGGLRFIMQQYGVTDFVTIQPYLQQLPRDYPIRVLTYAVAFRLWRQEGKLLAYEEGNNALKIQRMGIPGL